MVQTPEAAMLAATEAVLEFANGSLSFDEFVGRYGNYYHAAALDGHERDADYVFLLERYPEMIAFHEGVQEIIDGVYSAPDGSSPSPFPQGRIPLGEARPRVATLLDTVDVGEQVRRLAVTSLGRD